MTPWFSELLGLVPFVALGLAVPGDECSECGEPLPIVRKPANWRQGLWGGWSCPHCGVEFDRWGHLTGGPAASDAAHLTLSDEKLRELRPDLYGVSGFRRKLAGAVGLERSEREAITRHLREGDSRAAVVMSADPLLVAAYTDELDCVAILEFPAELAEDYGLAPGSRLLTLNSYANLAQMQADLNPGPNDLGNWTGFHPIIAEFASDEMAKIEARKAAIAEEEWRRAFKMGKAALKARPGMARDGRPGFAGTPAKFPHEL